MSGALKLGFDESVITARTEYLWFRTVQEIEERPNFFAGLEIADGDLSHIIGAYRVPAVPRFRCGLNGCNQPHQKGFLIANKAGRETVCGNVCGRRRLGADFVELEARFDATVAQAQHQQKLSDLRSTATDSLKLIYQLENELKLVYGPIREIRQQFRQEKTADPLILNLIREGGTVKRSRELSQRERDVSGNPHAKAVLETIGQVRGVQALESYARIANVLDVELRGTVEAVMRIDDVTEVQGRKLTTLSSAIQRMPTKIAEIRAFLSIAAEFLEPANFEELVKIAQMDRANERRLRPIFEAIRSNFGQRPATARIGG